jgi:hypothetical protein
MRIHLITFAAITAALLVVAIASADTSAPQTPPQTVKRPMVRNIGIAERGDAIIVRQRKSVPMPPVRDSGQK